ncbi:MAG: hypothetical protein O7D34_06520 [Ignavibacteria bacterium]|nr:hypothetical protein [Ignavibacteria bacterium]
MKKLLVDYYRCPERYDDFRIAGELPADTGYFRFGEDTVCYGQTSSGLSAKTATCNLDDVLEETQLKEGTCLLPLDPKQVVDNLRRERYLPNLHNEKRSSGKALIRALYYQVRPLLPVSVRKHLQRFYLRGWDEVPFPSWPVDRTVDRFHEKLLALTLQAHSLDRVPFVWFWPNGYMSSAVMTHDVETATGRDFCSSLMDTDDSFQIKSSFQLIPEKRYIISEDFLRSIREREFEVCVHGLCHDGHLFRNHDEFLRRAARINQYAKEWSALGFRSPVLYRNLDWYEALDFSYDMSVPNVAHLDPQKGGCCTVMPYFINNILEIPLTTTQDYTLFNILDDYSMKLWKTQLELIMAEHGLISFNIHPDYIIRKRASHTYNTLLEYLAELRSDRQVWIALPREVNTWWRQRSQMKLILKNGDWRIEGPGSDQARVAYAMLDGDVVVYEIEGRRTQRSKSTFNTRLEAVPR